MSFDIQRGHSHIILNFRVGVEYVTYFPVLCLFEFRTTVEVGTRYEVPLCVLGFPNRQAPSDGQDQCVF